MAIKKRRSVGAGAAFFIALALFVGLFVATVVAQTSGSMRYCEITLAGCPQDYDGRELVVPLDVISMSTRVQACGITDSTTTEAGTGTPPAIMFVIDHSGSMAGNNGHDNNGNRFRVTRALIDSVHAVYPNAEVGIVIFDIGLSLNASRDSNLVIYGGPPTANSDNSPHHTGSGANRRSLQGYMPLKPLNAPARREGGTSGNNNTQRFLTTNWQPEADRPAGTLENPEIIDLYRAMFNTPSNVNQAASIAGGPSTGNGTNISIAFRAALEAFELSGTTIPKDNRYIIFLSDGEPNPRTCGRNASDTDPCRSIYSFMHGDDVPNIPTTYTVFLNRLGTRDQLPMILDTVSRVPWGSLLAPPPATAYSVDTTLYRVINYTEPNTVPGMTNAIRNNGYSETNRSSDVWVLQSNYDAMLTLMMDNIITPMLSKIEGSAKSIVISSPGMSDSTGSITGGDFTFTRRLPIDTADVTPVTMGIRYDVRIDTSYTTPAGNDTSYTVRTARDSLFTYEFTVRRTADAGANWATTAGVEENCGERPTLRLMFRNETLANSDNPGVVSEAKGNMDSLTVVFDNTNGLFNYGNNVIVQVMNADGTFTDIENLIMTRGTGANSDVYTVTFQRVVDTTANPGDRRLQHASMDSIIVVFRNPQIPLDTLRVSVPYISTTMDFYSRDGAPTGAGNSKLPADTTLVAGTPLDLYAKFFDADGLWDQDIEQAIKDYPDRISWNVSGGGNATITGDGHHGQFYSEVAGLTYTVTATYKDGPLVVTQSIHITVVPGAPAYLQVVRDTSNVVSKADTLELKKPFEHEFDKNEDKVTLYVVERDRFGNIIRGPDGGLTGSGCANWETNDPGSLIITHECSITKEITRVGNTFISGLEIIVKKGDLETKVDIKVVGESQVSVGPNPFVPGRDSPMDRLDALYANEPGGTPPQYTEIIKGADGNTSKTGVLVAATSPRDIRKSANGSPMASIMIYDAVGNVVFRSKPGDITLASDEVTFGFVWDGKNNSGRTVGPGTYLVRIVGTQSDGQKFNDSRKIGVTVDGKTRTR